MPAIAALCAAAACGGAREQDSTTTANRIVALTLGSVDTLDLLGELGRAVAVEADCHVPGTEGLVKIANDDHVGPSRALSVEAVIALRPDLVIAKEDLRPALTDRDLAVLWVPARSDFESIEATVLAIGERIGVPQKAHELVDSMRARIATLRERTAPLPRVRVYYEAGRPGRTCGRGTLIHELIELAGGRNIAADVKLANPSLSAEAILASDPEVIVLSPWCDPPDAVARRPGWNRIAAVRDGRVYRVSEDRRELQSPSPKCVAACERELLAWLHPAAARGAK